MNFYIAMDEFDATQSNVYVQDTLIDFLQDRCSEFPPQISAILTIDLYSDEVISGKQLIDLYYFSQKVKSSTVLKDYDYKFYGDFEPYKTFHKLYNLSKLAILSGKNLFSYGD
ncbi:hypothetical protein ACTGZN_11775 [Streptococcus suis]